MMNENKLMNYFVTKRDNYLFSIFSALLSGFIIGFAFILSTGFLKSSDPYIYYFTSSVIFSLFLYTINSLNYHHFFQYSTSSYLFYRGKLRFSLFFYRILGIWIFNLLGIFIFLFLFYLSGLWKVGSSIGNLASKMGIYSLKFFSETHFYLFINSILTGFIGGFVFYFIFFKKGVDKFLAILLFSLMVLTGNFRYNLFDFFNLTFTFLIKKQFIVLGLRKYEILNFYDFFFKFLNVFSGNFIGAVFLFIPFQVILDKLKNNRND